MVIMGIWKALAGCRVVVCCEVDGEVKPEGSRWLLGCHYVWCSGGRIINYAMTQACKALFLMVVVAVAAVVTSVVLTLVILRRRPIMTHPLPPPTTTTTPHHHHHHHPPDPLTDPLKSSPTRKTAVSAENTMSTCTTISADHAIPADQDIIFPADHQVNMFPPADLPSISADHTHTFSADLLDTSADHDGGIPADQQHTTSADNINYETQHTTSTDQTDSDEELL
ncbi:hypothetical protein Pcinc_020336 [Petrolisthes cinctipes]|uniref:Uncharacterized protein n=1 Tax=Petrolisthes cinctipes TaxID=88211 RepID=A0AAE1FIC4_PETCI|nr:hypothetical protein Pcinc_020336 [Petrolisthes cinctipes]